MLPSSSSTISTTTSASEPKSKPPAEQSGYYILDVREDESFFNGPFLEIIPKFEQQQMNENQNEVNDNDSKATATTPPQKRCRTCHIPLSELQSRLFELPAKRTNLILIYDSDQNQNDEVGSILGEGWNVVDEFRMVGARNTEKITGDPARAKFIQSASWLIPPTEERIQQITKYQLQNKYHSQSSNAATTNTKLSSSSSSSSFHRVKNKYSPSSFSYLPFDQDEMRAWSPSPFLEQHLDSLIVPQFLLQQQQSTIASNTSSRIAVDIGSGNGRDIAYLASRGIFDSIFAIDNRHHLLQNSLALAKRYTKTSSSLCGASAASYNAVECTVTTCLPFREEFADFMICVRFLERPLLTSLARYLKVGGFLLYSHFVDGVQHSAVGQPKNPKHFVLHGELKKKIVDEAILPKSCTTNRTCTSNNNDDDDDDEGTSEVIKKSDWKIEVIIDEEVFLEDGRPVNNLLIRRVC